jgi:hypothetical protein
LQIGGVLSGASLSTKSLPYTIAETPVPVKWARNAFDGTQKIGVMK